MTMTLEAAWDYGYFAAVRGCTRNACSFSDRKRFAREWLAGWEAAVADGRWGTWLD